MRITTIIVRRCTVMAAMVTLLATGPVSAQDALNDARELYASAAYEEALAALEMARDRGGSEVDRVADEYSAFCLLALGRRPEAESAAEAAVRTDPLARLDSRDVSPRIDDLFRQVRKRLLPELIRAEYRTARDTMNRGETDKSIDQFVRVKAMIDASNGMGVFDEALADVSTLVDGFLDLNRAKIAERAALATRQPTPAPAPVAAAAANTALPARTIFSSADTDVTAPVPVRQQIPEVTLDSPTRDARHSGVLAVTIDEKGNVQNVAMRESISFGVDLQLVRAARTWQYQPAMRNGSPVRYIKLIGISIDK